MDFKGRAVFVDDGHEIGMGLREIVQLVPEIKGLRLRRTAFGPQVDQLVVLRQLSAHHPGLAKQKDVHAKTKNKNQQQRAGQDHPQ